MSGEGWQAHTATPRAACQDVLVHVWRNAWAGARGSCEHRTSQTRLKAGDKDVFLGHLCTPPASPLCTPTAGCTQKEVVSHEQSWRRGSGQEGKRTWREMVCLLSKCNVPFFQVTSALSTVAVFKGVLWSAAQGLGCSWWTLAGISPRPQPRAHFNGVPSLPAPLV